MSRLPLRESPYMLTNYWPRERDHRLAPLLAVVALALLLARLT